MKTLARTTALLLASVAGLSVTAVAAQPAPNPAPVAGAERAHPERPQLQAQRPGWGAWHGHHAPGPMRGPGGGFGPQQGPSGGLGLFDFGASAERIEIALVRLSYALELTEAQQPLFEALRTEALAAATAFSEAVAGLRADAAEAGDAPGRLAARIALETARLEALDSVLPAFEALYDALSPEQQAAFSGPRHPGRPTAPAAQAAPEASAAEG